MNLLEKIEKDINAGDFKWLTSVFYSVNKVETVTYGTYDCKLRKKLKVETEWYVQGEWYPELNEICEMESTVINDDGKDRYYRQKIKNINVTVTKEIEK